MNATLAQRGLRSAQELGASKPHGTRGRYLAGCKCVPCRAANSRASCAYDKAAREGNGNPIVSAKPVRKHLLKLAQCGLGRRLIADAAGVPQSTIRAIRMGTRRQVRLRTAERILAVTDELRGDATLLPAGPTWALIDKLLDEGFTRARLSALIGNNGRALQISTTFVTAKTACRVEKLYRFLLDREPRQRAARSVKQGYLSNRKEPNEQT